MHSLHTGRVGAKVFYKTGIEDSSFLVFYIDSKPNLMMFLVIYDTSMILLVK